MKHIEPTIEFVLKHRFNNHSALDQIMSISKLCREPEVLFHHYDGVAFFLKIPDRAPKNFHERRR